MPVTSAKQFRFMRMIASGKKPRSGIGPSPAVAQEFLDKTSHKDKSKFAKQGR